MSIKFGITLTFDVGIPISVTRSATECETAINLLVRVAKWETDQPIIAAKEILLTAA
jgi:hypothetical protein